MPLLDVLVFLLSMLALDQEALLVEVCSAKHSDCFFFFSLSFNPHIQRALSKSNKHKGIHLNILFFLSFPNLSLSLCLDL